MRVALIADIHGNRVALEAVRGRLEEDGVDATICLGDVAATGPEPREAVALLRSLNCPVVMGNADAWLLNPEEHAPEDDAGRRILEIDLWCADQLEPEDLAYLRTFQPTVKRLLAPGAALLCFHGTPGSNTEILLPTTPDDDVDRMLHGHHALIMAGGHTHRQMLRRHRDMILLNPGSVGLPFVQTDHVRNPPWAEYALLTWEDGALSVDLRRVPVDVRAIVESARASAMPHAEWWAGDWAAA